MNTLTKLFGDIKVSLRSASFIFNASREIGKTKFALVAWFKEHKPKEKIEFENAEVEERVGLV